MPKQLINIGSNPNDGTGDTLRQGADKVNDNFNEIYEVIGVGNTLNAPQSIGYADVAGVATAAQGITGSPNITVGLCSATTLTGDLTGDVTGNLTGYASTSGVSTVSQGLTGSPDVSVGNVVGTSATFTGIVTASQLDGQLNSSNLTGQLPVLDGSNLTNVIATGSGVDIYDDGSIVGTAVTINLGTNIKATPVVAGITTLNSEQFSHTDVGIHTLANVGVGTTNPTYQLTVGGSGASFITSTRYNNQALNFNDNAWVSSSATGDIVTFQINTGSDAASDFGSFVFRTTDPGFPSLTQDALRIYSAGDSPDRLVKIYRSLEVGNNASVQNSLYVGSNNSGELSQFNTDLRVRSATGNVRIEPVVSSSVIFQDDQQRQMARFYPGGSCELYHGYVKKFETSSLGATVDGTLTAGAYLGDGSLLTGIDASALKDGASVKVQAVAGGANVTGDLGVSGNVSIAGTLTYEDAKNIDVIGVATFRDSITVNADGAADDPNVVTVKGKQFWTGDVNSSGEFKHYGKLEVSGQQGILLEQGGAGGSDFLINNSDGYASQVKTDHTNGLFVQSDKITITNEDKSKDYVKCGFTENNVQLFHNDNLRLETTNGGAVLTGILTATTFIGSLTGNVTGNCSGSSGSCTGNSATATKVYVNEYTNDSTNRPLVFAYTTTTANSANRDLGKDHQHLYWNGNSNTLTAPTFSGALSGNASTSSNSSLLEGFPLETISWGHNKTHGTYTNFNTFTGSNLFGAHFVQGTSNGPGQSGATQYYHQRLSLGSNYDNYALQLAIGRNRSDNYLWYRSEENGSQGSWYKMRAGYADSAGSASNATVASSCSGNSATASLATNANNAYACSGNAATATTATTATSASTAAACTGNSATATTAAACSGNSATATSASACTGGSALVYCEESNDANDSFNIPFTYGSGNANKLLTIDTGSLMFNPNYNQLYVAWAAMTGVNGIYFGSGVNSNIAFGQYALNGGSNCPVYYNVALGYYALTDLDSTTYSPTAHIAIGYYASEKYTGKQYGNTNHPNTAVGARALQYNNSEGCNVAVGSQAGRYLNVAVEGNYIGGFYNVFVGCEAGKGYASSTWNVTNTFRGSNNVCVGQSAGASGRGHTFDNNTAIGAYAGNSSYTGNNNGSFGYGANPSSTTSNNEITLGNGSISTLRCNDTSIASLSDARDKTDVVDLPAGLNFITSLRPVKFKWDSRKEEQLVLNKDTGEDELKMVGNGKDGKTRAGFLAQDLQAAMTSSSTEYLDLVYDGNPDKLEAKYGNLIPALVQSIKDLKEANDSLTARITALGG